jgi:hypothetical protein
MYWQGKSTKKKNNGNKRENPQSKMRSLYSNKCGEPAFAKAMAGVG